MSETGGDRYLGTTRVVEALRRASPRLAAMPEEPDFVGDLALGQLRGFAHRVTEDLRDGHVEEFPAIFEVIEENCGLDVVILYFLESIYNISTHIVAPWPDGPARFLPWLGPDTRQWWDEWHAWVSGS